MSNSFYTTMSKYLTIYYKPSDPSIPDFFQSLYELGEKYNKQRNHPLVGYYNEFLFRKLISIVGDVENNRISNTPPIIAKTEMTIPFFNEYVCISGLKWNFIHQNSRKRKTSPRKLEVSTENLIKVYKTQKIPIHLSIDELPAYLQFIEDEIEYLTELQTILNNRENLEEIQLEAETIEKWTVKLGRQDIKMRDSLLLLSTS